MLWNYFHTNIDATFRALARGITSWQFISKLGLNLRSAARNATQSLQNYVYFGFKGWHNANKYLQDKKSNMLLQIHDEIICEIHKDELKTIPFKIKELLETNSLDIPLQVDMEECSPSWATKKDFVKPDDPVDDFIDWE